MQRLYGAFLQSARVAAERGSTGDVETLHATSLRRFPPIGARRQSARLNGGCRDRASTCSTAPRRKPRRPLLWTLKKGRFGNWAPIRFYRVPPNHRYRRYAIQRKHLLIALSREELRNQRKR